MQKVFRITVDISKKIPAHAFEVNTNDLKSVKLEITITNGQSLLDLTDVTPRINIRKPDNEVIFQDCEIVDATAGKVQIVLENQAYLVPGTHTAEIACYKGNEITAITGTFSYKSVKGIMNDKAVESKSEFTAIDRKIAEARKLLEDAAENGVGVDEQARQEIQEVAVELAGKATVKKVNDNANMYWIPPVQPPARSDATGYFADGFSWNAQQYIDNLFEPLRTANTSYVTRDNLGKDASGKHDIWRYYFTPKNFKKTIIIGTCIHGGETTPMMAMYRFLYHLINDWDKYPQLSYIRHNVRIVYLPIQNPWGLSQLPRKRQNSNGVDLNRNFDYKWSEYTSTTQQPFGHDYKGTSPFSEIESQYIRNTLKQFSDATAYLDMHNLGEPSGDYILYNSANSPNQHIYDNLVDYLTKGMNSPVIVNEKQETPSAYNYAFKLLKIPSGNPEWADRRFGGSMYNSIEITKSLEWFANVVLQHSRGDILKPDEPFVIENYYSRGGTGDINLAPTNYADIPQFNFSFDVPCDGIVLFEGMITIKGTDAAAQNFIYPKLGQVGSDFNPTDNRTGRYEVYNEGMARQTIPFFAQTTVKQTAGNVGQVLVGLRGYTTAGTCTIFRYRGRITFIPSKHLNKFQIFTASTRESQGANAMIKEFPNN